MKETLSKAAENIRTWLHCRLTLRGGPASHTILDEFHRQSAGEKDKAFKAAWTLFKHLDFVGRVIEMRLAFFNWGFDIKPESDSEKFQEWKRANRRSIRNFIYAAWLDWLIQENYVIFWRADSAQPILLPISKCQYSDEMGMERLTYEHGIPRNQVEQLIAELRLDDAAAAQYRKGRVHLHELEDHHFLVQKLGKVGEGFGYPSIGRIIDTGEQWLSLKAADRMLSEEARVLIKRHKAGHEIKSGPQAGNPVHFLKKGRAKSIETGVKGKTGVVQMVTNFDETTEFSYLDNAFFDEKKYDGALKRLRLWSMPIGQMLDTTSTPNPNLLKMLRAEAHGHRDRLVDDFERVINEVFQPPVTVHVRWRDDIFLDQRTAVTLFNGMKAGPVSQRSFQEFMGLDPEMERARKSEEAALPRDQTFPIFDPDHGGSPASENPGGRPASTEA